MSKSRKESTLEADKLAEPKAMAFEDWFTLKVEKEPKLKPWQRREIELFFKHLGLSAFEKEEEFEKALKLY